MKPVFGLIARIGATLHPLATLGLVIALNVQWVFTLQALGDQFERSAGVPLLDLQNVQGILSPDAAQALVAKYSPADISLYWTFFAMDNVVPLLSFGSLALLWAFFLTHSRLELGKRLAASWLILLPFAVGGFDIVENVFFVSALATDDSTAQLALLGWGLGFVQAKAIALYLTFAGTVALLGLYIAGRIRARARGAGAVSSAATAG